MNYNHWGSLVSLPGEQLVFSKSLTKNAIKMKISLQAHFHMLEIILTL